MDTLNAAVIGTGLIGTVHARVYRQHPLARLRAVCDVDLGVAQALASELGVNAYDDYESMLAHEQLDVVSIATPEQHRLSPTVAAASHGLALMLEKPLGTDLEQVDRLLAALDGYERPVAVNFILHADPRYATMRERVRSGDVGAVASYYLRRRGTKAGIEKYAPWTDLLTSTAIHDLEMLLSVHPAPPSRVFAESVVRHCEPFGCEDAIVAVIKFADGAVASLETSWTLPTSQPEPLDPAFHVVGDQGGIFIEGSSHGLRVLGNDTYTHLDMTHWPLLPYGVGGAFERSLGLFLEGMAIGAAPLVGLAQARKAHELVAALKLSLARETVVPLPLS
jgi:predicted dehydrogenase